MNHNKEYIQRENMTMRALYLIAAILVVDGHTTLADMFDMQSLFRYYSFHLMLFAFGSGYFFKDGDDQRPLASIARKARRLLIPLYLWNVVYGVSAALLRRFVGFDIGEPVTLYNLLIAPLTDGHQFQWNLGSWFVFPLFMCQVIYTFVRRLAKLWGDREAVTFLLCLIPGVICVTLCNQNMQAALPLWVLRTLILLPGYAGGVLYRRCLEKHDTLPTVPYLTALVIIRALLCARYENLAYLLSTCDYFGCDAFGVYFGGTIAIAFFLRIARLIAPHMQRSRFALAISRNTFAIMMHHYMGFFALNCVFLALHVMGLYAKDFSVYRWRTESNYMYAPGGRPEWDVLYLLAGLVLPLAVAWVVNKGKTIIQKKLRR